MSKKPIEAFDELFNSINYNTENAKQGMALLSEPFLNDPNFARSVVLLVRHDDNEGSLGFVLNQESNFTINEALSDFPKFDTKVRLGGPVGTENLFYIHSRNDIIEEGVEIIPGLFWGGDFEQVKSAIADNRINNSEILFFVGYSGWEQGQLKNELEEHSWIVTDISKNEILTQNSDELWKNKLKELGDNYKRFSQFPEDPSLN